MDRQQPRKFKRRHRWADVLAALILLGLLLLGIFTIRDLLRSRVLNFAYVEEGSIAVTLPGEIMVLRHEYVLSAPAAGEFNPVAEEGERIKEGGLVGYCGGVALTASKGGVVSYQLDGWEQKLSIEDIHELDWQQTFLVLREQAAQPVPPELLQPPQLNSSASRVVARLVDNLLDYRVLLRLQDPRELLAEAKKITFTLPEGRTFSVNYRNIQETAEGDIYYIFDISSKEDALFNLRYSEVEVIAKEIEGIIIPSEAVTVNELGISGVYIQKKRKLVFTEITELTSKDGYSVVSGLERTAVIVTNPAKARDGQRI